MGASQIEFLTRANCRNSDKLIVELYAALAQLAAEATPVIVDLDKLKQSDYRTGYGTPTILVNGVDLFGAPKPEPATPA